MAASAKSRPSCEPLESRALLNAGDADLTFSGDGRTTLSFPGLPFTILDTALQGDGKIVVAGRIDIHAAVARLNADGSVDTSFGTGGLFEYGAVAEDPATAAGIAIDGNGKIVIGGFARVENVPRIALARLNTNGSRDTSFGTGGAGVVRMLVGGSDPNGGSKLEDIAIQRDGKIVGAGYIQPNDFDFGVVRFNSDGSPDNTFDGNGVRSDDFGDVEEKAHALTIDYNGTAATNPLYGTIVVVGETADMFTTPPNRFTLMRLRPDDGSLDSSFSGDGKLVSPDLSSLGSESATGVVVQPGGKIVVCGFSQGVADPSQSNFIISRYNSNGALDNTFGLAASGVVELDPGVSDAAKDIAVNYVGGLAVSGVSDGHFAISALKDDGKLDLRFSGDGTLTTSIAGDGAGISATLNGIAPIRRLVVVGGTSVARFVDVGSIVFVQSLDSDASETGPDPANLQIGRTQALPFVERIFLNVSGTATPPNTFPIRPADYSGTNITFGSAVAGPTFVDIPANQMFAPTVTITPINDTTAEPDEAAIFTVASNIEYDIGSPPSVTLAIRDNDTVGGPTVTSSAFVFDSGPPQRVTFTFSQNVATSIGASDFSVTGPSGSVPFALSYDSITNAATLAFTGVLPDGNYTAKAIAAGITNSGGTPMAADATLAFFFLNGDANHDRTVDVTDLGVLATNWQGTGTFSMADFNYDGLIDVTDLGVLATNWQKSLPAPASLALSASTFVKHNARSALVDQVLN